MKKCPKCKSKKLDFLEFWKNHTISWSYGSSMDDGYLEMGEPYKVEAKCTECGHSWTLRGIIQISEEMFVNES
jgi:hypothetical protein